VAPVFKGLSLAEGRLSGRSQELASLGGSARLTAGWMSKGGDLVLEAVKTARKNHRGGAGGRGASAEWSQTDCQPCVSLV